jgi:hypothetical protein
MSVYKLRVAHRRDHAGGRPDLALSRSARAGGRAGALPLHGRHPLDGAPKGATKTKYIPYLRRASFHPKHPKRTPF